ncbi:MAG: potassium channel family protein [Myxococcota bacterium]
MKNQWRFIHLKFRKSSERRPHTVMKFFVVSERCLHVMEGDNRKSVVNERGGYVKLIYFIITILSVPNMLMEEKGVLSISFTALLLAVLVVKDLSRKRKPFHLYLFISIIAFFSDVSYMGNSEHKFTSNIQISADVLQLVFTFFVLYLISREIFQKEKITKDAVAGGVCIYLLLGNVWSLVYANLYLFEKGAFHGPDGVISSFDFLYFSFATFTSTGYGDIVPVSIIAKSIAMLESVVGILLPIIFISRLVELYGEAENQSVAVTVDGSTAVASKNLQEDMLYEHNSYVGFIYFLIAILSVPNVFMKEKGVLSIIFTALLITTLLVENMNRKKKPFYLYLFIAIVAFFSDVSYMENSQHNLASNTQILADLLHFIFTCFALYLISREIFQKKKITKDAIAGGICIYLLVGNAWSLIYANLYLLDHAAFHAPGDVVSSFDFLYFSFTTFTSTGYGDFLPVSVIAKSFAIAESIVGVMLPTVLISRLVELYGKSGE